MPGLLDPPRRRVLVNIVRRWRRRLHCPHSRLDPIYGVAIRFVGYFRLYCLDCGAYLDGPVKLARWRRDEWDT